LAYLIINLINIQSENLSLNIASWKIFVIYWCEITDFLIDVGYQCTGLKPMRVVNLLN